ncbi:hypothetical protein [Pleionea sp. CnH1-48]|uniref:hypothetical protein n=1 Tax=Pleionea sp. CnH1-48 TaxID=2954494 RepID=UPI0020982DC4|nr:hypothetical protein [Pleionea sp. CnH1-48]MCO7223137.1 hypothetical protein [Pleionea sp. CnH1-48]
MRKLIIAVAFLFTSFTFALEKPLNKACVGCTEEQVTSLFKQYLKQQYTGLGCTYVNNTCSDDGGVVYAELWLVYTGDGFDKGFKLSGSIDSYGSPSVIKAWALSASDVDVIRRIDMVIVAGNEFIEALINNPHNQPPAEKESTNSSSCNPNKDHVFDYFNGNATQKVNRHMWDKAEEYSDKLEVANASVGVQVFGTNASANLGLGNTGSLMRYPFYYGGRLSFSMIRDRQTGVVTPTISFGHSRAFAGDTLINYFKSDGKGGVQPETLGNKEFPNECVEKKYEEAVKEMGWEIKDTGKQSWHREIGSNGQCGYVGHGVDGYTYRYQTYVFKCRKEDGENICGRIYTNHTHTVKFPTALQHREPRCGNVFPQQFGINVP